MVTACAKASNWLPSAKTHPVLSNEMTEQEVLAQVRSLYLRLLPLGTYQQ